MSVIFQQEDEMAGIVLEAAFTGDHMSAKHFELFKKGEKTKISLLLSGAAAYSASNARAYNERYRDERKEPVTAERLAEIIKSLDIQEAQMLARAMRDEFKVWGEGLKGAAKCLEYNTDLRECSETNFKAAKFLLDLATA